MMVSSFDRTNTAPPVSPTELAAPKRPYLIVIAGTHVGELHKITKPKTLLGRKEAADIRIVDDGVSREHVELLIEGERVLIHDLGSTNGTYVNGARVYGGEVADGDKISLGATTILKFTLQDGIEQQYQRQLYESAVRDGLTHSLKREFFLERLDAEVAFAVRHSAVLALVLWDIDRFKVVNDRFGHLAGDRILEATARAVASSIRREDIFGRYGGEEFGLVCRATSKAGALRTAERLRKVIAETAVESESERLRVTASFGVAFCPEPGISTQSELIAAADAALYRAKRSGRNRVEVGGE